MARPTLGFFLPEQIHDNTGAISVTYDSTSVSDDELVAMNDLLSNYVGDIVAQIHEDRLRYNRGVRTTGSQIKLLTVAHGFPCTHQQARRNARRLADALVGNDLFIQTNVPRFHYASQNGGLRPDFSGDYFPGRFGARTNLGPAWICVCAIHNSDYDRCDAKCPIGVQFNGRFLIDIVRGLNGSLNA